MFYLPEVYYLNSNSLTGRSATKDLRGTTALASGARLDQDSSTKPVVGIFRRSILPLTETFIKAQADAMRRYQPRYVGLSAASNSLVDEAGVTLLSRHRPLLSRVQRALYGVSGFAPGFHRAVRNLHPALIHAHFGPDAATATPLCAALGVPLVVTLHGYDVTTQDAQFARSSAGRLFLRKRHEMWERTALFLCVSEFIRTAALTAGYPEAKLRVQYIGIDRTLYAPVEHTGEKLILFVGRLVDKKGCIHLLRAMQVVQAKEPTARLVVIGNGPLRSALEDTARSLGISCEFLGGQPSSVVHDWMKRARVLCMPSVTAADGDSEGLGMVLLEAQSMGRPVVGFRTGGIPEAVSDGESGLLAPEGDEAGLAENLLRYLTDNVLWQRASARAIAWVEERFDLAVRTREMESIYDGLLAQP